MRPDHHRTRHDDGAARLVAALTRPECYPHPVREIQVIETHISWVLTTGDYAYKIKKPVNLAFLDFSSLGLRRFYCEEELRLNRRFAPDTYLEVVEIRGAPQHPVIGGEGPVLEYAVKMREFAQDALADRLLARGELPSQLIIELARKTAAFHAQAARAGRDSRFGMAPAVLDPALENFRQILPLLDAPPDKSQAHSLRYWTEQQYRRLSATFAQRRERGFIRECHGDLHLGNVALVEGAITAFDCIEFAENLRWIDVMSEVAFLVMDLVDHERPDLAYLYLNTYLEHTGDYAGLAVLRFYLVYRALVRAKVNCIHSRQPGLGREARWELTAAFRQYIALATRLSAPARPALVITHGVSGSGKTTATQALAQYLGAIRLRSDVERKRLHGLDPFAASGSGVASGIYSREASAATYRRLAQLARTVLAAGYPVIVDAAFLDHAQRTAFHALAAELHLPFAIIDFVAAERQLRERLARRAASGSDASEADVAVLEHQLVTSEPLTAAEIALAVRFNAGRTAAELTQRETWRPVLRRLNGLPAASTSTA